ncbi:MAG TPA: hypothetical protein VIS55_07240 [Pseudomonadales bacterium]|jgi:glutathione S-transferase
MDYLTVDEAKRATGLRLVLTQGVPGPWGESAKALFDLKGVAYHPVAQKGGAANEELLAWTGHRNAPIAILDDEPPRASWLEILFLAERLGESPRLLPEDIDQRMLVIGLSSEICSPGGFAWQSRMFLLQGMAKAAGDQPENFPMLKDYSYSQEAADRAVASVKPILDRLGRQLDMQAAAGSDYLVGGELTAVDVYWAFFSQLLVPLPEAICPMPGFLRKSYGMLGTQLEEPAPASLLAHRDRILERHIALPLTF